MQTIRIFEDYETVSEGAALLISEVAMSSIEKNDRFTIALSGGGTPKKLFEILASEKYRNEDFWKKTFVFWGDERYVPEDAEDNNSHMAKELLLKHVPIPEENIFPVNTALPAEEAAADYALQLTKVFGDQHPTFDLNLLGLGDNGHTASLFPHTEILNETEDTVKAIYVDEVQMYRISFTATLINASKIILFLVTGKGKSEVIANVIEGPFTPQKLPAQLIKGLNNNLFFYLDKDAASKLKDVDI